MQVQTLPWVARLALERGLGARASQLDLHQRLVAYGEDPAVLMHWIASPASAWLGKPLRSFLARWADPASGLQDRINELYLEWDVPAEARALPAPSLFLGTPRDRVFAAADLPMLFDVWRTVGLEPARLAPLERLWALAVPGIGVRHVGLMLSRGGGLRINIKGLDQERLLAVLISLGWRGDRARALSQFEEIAGLCDGITVALDWIADDILPRIGFELFLDRPVADHPMSADLSRYMAESVCVTREEGVALARFDCQVDALTGDWPARWVLSTMRQPVAVRPHVKIRMSHLKLVLEEDGVRSAKCYLACEHWWNPVAGVEARDAV